MTPTRPGLDGKWVFLLSMALVATGCGSEAERDRELTTLTDLDARKAELVADVEQELAEIEIDVGVLRSNADATQEDFTAELVHLDELIEGLETRLDGADVETMDELTSLNAETRRRLDEIGETYAALERRVEAAASSATDANPVSAVRKESSG